MNIYYYRYLRTLGGIPFRHGLEASNEIPRLGVEVYVRLKFISHLFRGKGCFYHHTSTPIDVVDMKGVRARVRVLVYITLTCSVGTSYIYKIRGYRLIITESIKDHSLGVVPLRKQPQHPLLQDRPAIKRHARLLGLCCAAHRLRCRLGPQCACGCCIARGDLQQAGPALRCLRMGGKRPSKNKPPQKKAMLRNTKHKVG